MEWKVVAAVIMLTITVLASACIFSRSPSNSKGTTSSSVMHSWVEAIGNKSLTIGMTVAQMPDGDYVIVGMTNATAGGSGGVKAEDFLVIMLSPDGKVIWQRTYGGKSWDYAISVAVSRGGEIAIGGSSGSFGGAWLLLLNDSGKILGQFKYAGMSINALEFDGNYIIAAGRYGLNGMIMKLSKNGSVIWSYVINNTGVTAPSSLKVLSNGDILVAGTTSGFGSGQDDFWLAEFNPKGKLVWQKAYGGKGEDILYGMAVHDGDVYLAGTTNSFGLGRYSTLLVKADLKGDVKWAKVLLPPKEGWANSVAVSKSGTVLLGGISYTLNGSYAWLVGMRGGRVKWQRLFGGKGMTWVKSVKAVTGGYVMVGSYDAHGAMILLKPPESRSVLVMRLKGAPPVGYGFTNVSFKVRDTSVASVNGRTPKTETTVHMTPKETSATSTPLSLPVRVLWRERS